jgi:hypothetical protein
MVNVLLYVKLVKFASCEIREVIKPSMGRIFHDKINGSTFL